MDIINTIEEIMGDLSAKTLIEKGYIRLNASDIGLDCACGTIFLDLENKAILKLNTPHIIDTNSKLKYVQESCKMKVQMGNQSISIYLAEDERVEECFYHYYNIYLPDVKYVDDLARKDQV